MRINLGCDDKRIDGYLNVDMYNQDADVVADIREWRPVTGTVEEVLAIHVIEHLTEDEAVDLCRRVLDWLKPGGRLIVEMPCRRKCSALATGNNHKYVCDGLKGIVGGRPVAKDKWLGWLIEHRRQIIDAADSHTESALPFPEEYNIPGTIHKHLWVSSEFSDCLRKLSYRFVWLETPRYHGRRTWRDFRCVAQQGGDYPADMGFWLNEEKKIKRKIQVQKRSRKKELERL